MLAFVRGPLDVQQEEVPDLQIESIRRTRVSPKSLVRDEVVVVFKDANTRGLLASKGRNLARYVGSNGKPEAGIRMDIPAYLTSTFQMLENHAFNIKRHNGPGTRKYIKFDEPTLDLYLEVKLPEEERWIRISPTQARGLQRLDEETGIDVLHERLLGKARGAGKKNANHTPLGSRPRQATAAHTSSTGARRTNEAQVPPPSTDPTTPNGNSNGEASSAGMDDMEL